MRLAHLVAALLLLPVVAVPAVGDFHEALDTVPDRVFVLAMHGTSFNGMEHPETPLLEAYVGEKLHFSIVVPPAAEPHTFHLHGHPWLVESQGRVVDTVLVRPGETHSFDVIAGGVDHHAGDWMYHCHIASHQAAGMWGILRVYPYRAAIDAPGPLFTVTLDRLGAAVEGAALALEVDGAPFAAHIADLGEGRYLVHAPGLPAEGQLVVKASHATLGVSLARADLATGAPPTASLTLTAHHRAEEV